MSYLSCHKPRGILLLNSSEPDYVSITCNSKTRINLPIYVIATYRTDPNKQKLKSTISSLFWIRFYRSTRRFRRIYVGEVLNAARINSYDKNIKGFNAGSETECETDAKFWRDESSESRVRGSAHIIKFSEGKRGQLCIINTRPLSDYTCLKSGVERDEVSGFICLDVVGKRKFQWKNGGCAGTLNF